MDQLFQRIADALLEHAGKVNALGSASFFGGWFGKVDWAMVIGLVVAVIGALCHVSRRMDERAAHKMDMRRRQIELDQLESKHGKR
jgi:hypothetical protein